MKNLQNVFPTYLYRSCNGQNGKLLTAVGLLHVARLREASMHKTTQYTRNSIVCGPAHTVLSRFLAHAPIAEKRHFEKVLKNQLVPAFWRMRLYSNRGAGAPINAHTCLYQYDSRQVHRAETNKGHVKVMLYHRV